MPWRRKWRPTSVLLPGKFHGQRSLPGSSVHGNFPGKNTGVGYHALLQGILPAQGLNLCFRLPLSYPVMRHWGALSGRDPGCEKGQTETHRDRETPGDTERDSFIHPFSPPANALSICPSLGSARDRVGGDQDTHPCPHRVLSQGRYQ